MHQVTIGASSATAADSAEFGRRRGANTSVPGRTQILNIGVGRNKAPKLPANSRSTSTVSVSPRIRALPDSQVAASSDTSVRGIFVFPPVAPPTGEILMLGNKFNQSRLLQLDTHSIDLTITGNRLTELELEFTASTLQGEQAMRKTSSVAPGGIILDPTVIPHTDGKQTLVATILLLPSETKRQEKEVEIKYELRAFNTITNRDYTIETGFFFLYQA
jgi:hypothetical protein